MPVYRKVLFWLLIAALAAGAALVMGQESESLPPQVIGVQPYPGEEMPLDAPLAIVFDQPMNPESVEFALSIAPVISSTLTWIDERTLQIVPEGGWERDAEYIITIGTGATTAEGAALPEAYSFTAQSVGNLEVGSVVPASDTNQIPVDAKITVAFNRPVVPLGSTAQMDNLPNPLTIEPAVSGKGEWVNTSLFQFTPDALLLGGTTYTVTLNDLTAFDGASLAEPFRWSFRTLLPEMLWSTPEWDQTGVLLDQPLRFGFSQPMDHASTVSLQQNGQPVSGTYSWESNDTVMVFTPDQPLQIDTDYEVVIDGENLIAVGGATAVGDVWSIPFHTVPLPGVASTYPEQGEVGISPVSVYTTMNFYSPMNRDTLEGRIRIDPDPGQFTPFMGESTTSLSLEFPAKGNTRYTITLLAGAEDIYGNAMPNDYSYSFMTGSMPSNAYITGGDVQITGAYRQNTAVQLEVRGNPTVHFELYTLPESEIPKAFERWNFPDHFPPARNNLIREWTSTLDTGDGAALVKMAVAEEGTLPIGTYYLRMYYVDSASNYEYDSQIALMVVNSAVTLKRDEDGLLVWVTDLQTGQPLAGQEVTVFSHTTEYARGTTDEQGILRLNLDVPLDPAEDGIAVISASGDHFGVWDSTGAPDDPDQNVYIYTDRPIYRPGETIYYRGVYRQIEDVVDYSVGEPIYGLQLTARVNYDTIVYETADIQLTEMGTFSGEIVLPEDVPTGQIEIVLNEIRNGNVYLGSVAAQIAEYRVPEYLVEVTAAQDSLIATETARALLNSSFFSGGAVSNANLTWNAVASRTSFFYEGEGGYSFNEMPLYNQEYWSDPYNYGTVTIAEGSGVTSASGQFIMELTGEQTAVPGAYPLLVSMEGTVTDESGQFISGRASTIIHPGEVYVGVDMAQYFGEAGEPMQAELLTVSPDSVIAPDQLVTVSVVERRWERLEIPNRFGQYDWEQRDIVVSTEQISTDENGRATYEFTPPNGGRFLIRAEVRDELERLHRSERGFYVVGGRVLWSRPNDFIEMVPDKPLYSPGETAKILIPISLEGRSRALITVERAGVMSYEIREVEGSTLVYELPITDEYAPTIYLGVVLIHGIDELTSFPTYRSGEVAIQVEPSVHALELTVTPSALNTQPGETVTFDIEARDREGNPVQAEVGLALVDAAILTLAPPNSSAPIAHYYSYAGNYTTTDIALRNLTDALLDSTFGPESDEPNQADKNGVLDQVATTGGGFGGGGGGGGGVGEPVLVRQDFQQTPLWEPHVMTDAVGQAQVSVTMPDNLTIWHLDARAVTPDTKVGMTELEVQSTLPLVVRPTVPRFFVVGDEVVLAMVVNNNTGADQTVRVMLQGTGFELLEGESLEKSVDIAKDSRARVEWRVKILDMPYVDLTFFAIGADGYQDASKPPLATGPDGTIPVYRYTAPDTTGTGGVLREEGSRTEGISLPPFVDSDQGELTVQLDPSLAATTLDALDYLEEYPHACIEQTVSRFLPNVMTFLAFQAFNVQNAELESDLMLNMNAALDVLRTSQNPDGGWGWFANMESNALVTAYALLGLIEANQAGFDIDMGMADRAVDIVRADLLEPDATTDIWRLNRQAFYLYVLSHQPEYAPSQESLDALFNVRLEMSHYAKAYLLMAYTAVSPSAIDKIQALYSDLISAAQISATGAHWEEAYTDWWNWNTQTRSTALILAALVSVNPNEELLPNVVRWLMVARQGDHWETTQETVWSVMALTDWMVATGELEGNYEFSVALNGDPQTTGTVTPDTIQQGQELHIAVADLLSDEMNRLSVVRGEGQGNLYYTAHLQLRLDASQVDALDRGVSITREYYIEGNESPVTEATMGDTINVRLTLIVPETIYYFVLEDPIPAGTEPIDTGLLTTSQQAEDPTLQSADREAKWWWYWWIWDHTEMRDESVNLYADYLPPGTYVYTYQLQATAPGDFQVLPSHGYAFYFPEVFGRSAGELFTVLPGEETTEE